MAISYALVVVDKKDYALYAEIQKFPKGMTTTQCCGPCIFHVRSHSTTLFAFYLFGEKYDLLEKSWSRHLLLLLLLRENKVRKKTLSVTPYLEKTVYGKPKSNSGVRLPIRKVR